MIRKRFPWPRRGRITVWTAFVLAWASALIARSAGGPAATVPEPVTVVDLSPLETFRHEDRMATIPEAPEDGLVILHYTPAERPEPEVRRVVVTQQAPARSAPQAPTTQRSSGS